MQTLKANSEQTRLRNRSLILGHLRASGPLSRTELSKRTALAPSALSVLTRDLVNEEILKESGKASQAIGRPRTLLSLNPNFASSIGFKVERSRLLAARIGIFGTISARAEIKFVHSPSPEDVIEGCRQLSDELGTSNSLGVGLCTSGLIDPESGANLFSPILEWRNAPLRSPLAEALSQRVWVENDVNALALAEKWYGVGQDCQHFVCITVGEGIGAGVVIGGELYRGVSGGAGEIGHTTYRHDGEICRCGERGCLEMYASDAFLISEADRLGLDGIHALAAAARSGSDDALKVFLQMGFHLGMGVKDVVNLLNPEVIVLGGERMDVADLFLEAFEEAVRRHAFPEEARDLGIRTVALGEDGFLIGAGTLPIASYFANPVTLKKAAP
jgi:N-acetylglucosamine repressor